MKREIKLYPLIQLAKITSSAAWSLDLSADLRVVTLENKSLDCQRICLQEDGI